MSGTTGNDTLVISISGHYLAHGRFTAGDPGFVSDLDFDSSTAGEQKLVDDGTSSLLIDGLAGTDTLVFNDGYDINGNNILEVNSTHIYPGSETGGNRPIITYKNFEILNVSPQVPSNPKVVVADLYPSVYLTFYGRDDQAYELGDFRTGNLDIIQGTVGVYSGGNMDVYDPANTNNNVLSFDPSNQMTRNGKLKVTGSSLKALRWWSGSGHNQYFLKSNSVPDMEINGNNGIDDFVLGSDSANLDDFREPIQINRNGSGLDSLVVNDNGSASGHSYVLYGSGPFVRDNSSIILSASSLYAIAFHFGSSNDVVTVNSPYGYGPFLLDAGPGGSSDILDFNYTNRFQTALNMNVLGNTSMITGPEFADFSYSGFDYLFVTGSKTGDHMRVIPSTTTNIEMDGDAPTTGLLDALTVVPLGRPYTLTGDTFQAQGCKPVTFYAFESVMTELLDDDTSIPTGWSQLGSTTAKASTSVDTTNTALLATITADPDAGYRTIGWLSDAANTIHYSSVGSDNFVRAKYYIYSTGQTGTYANSIPNFRLRLANRFAVTSMLTVSTHENSDPEGTALGFDIRPGFGAPSIYRVDLDPIDVPQLVNNAATEGFLRSFEIFEHDPQANGSIGMTESSILVYPRLTDSSTTVPVTQNGLIKSYRTSATGSGDFGTGNIGSSNSSAVTAKYFNGAVETTGGLPSISVGSAGVTMETLNVESNRLGVAAFDVFNDTGDQTNHLTRARIEPNKQYRIRFHATSTTASNLQPLLRFRARSLKFMYTSSLEVGGATGASPASNAIAAQALPGIGNQIPTFDRINPSENGGWYNVMMVSPMNPDIQMSQFTLAAQDDPGEDTQPANNSKSRRDLQFGFDIIDTVSAQPTSGLERGQLTVDRVDIEKYDLLPN